VAPLAPRWRPGFGYEFLERPDGYRGLAEAYGLRFGQAPRTMELGLIYRALKEKQVDIVAGNSTDGAIAALDFVALEDDRGYFPPYQAAPVVRADRLAARPGLRAALERLAGALSAADMRRLNEAVETGRRPARAVAREFLRDRGL
jgi:osmoprotectant transport system substrate-binding protein